MALFTAETAVIAAKKSHSPESARFLPKPAIVDLAIPARIEPNTAEIDPFVSKTLARTRRQISRIQGLIEDQSESETLDCAALDRLASALSRLSELERQLAGRPLPGSYRPAADKASRRQNRAVEVWSDPVTPQQVVSGVPVQNVPQPVQAPPVQGPENG